MAGATVDRPVGYVAEAGRLEPDLWNARRADAQLAVPAGGYHSVVAKQNGQVVAWGQNAYGQTNIPVGLSNVVSLAGGVFHTLALKSDGLRRPIGE